MVFPEGHQWIVDLDKEVRKTEIQNLLNKFKLELVDKVDESIPITSLTFFDNKVIFILAKGQLKVQQAEIKNYTLKNDKLTLSNV